MLLLLTLTFRTLHIVASPIAGDTPLQDLALTF